MKPEEFNSKVLPMRQELKCYALKLSGNDDDAEDLVQEVMLRLLFSIIFVLSLF